MSGLREDLEAASSEISGTETPEPTATPSAGVEASATPEPATGETSSTPAPTTETTGRDSAGRFLPKSTAGATPGQATSSKPPTEGVASSTKQPEAAAATQTKPPEPGPTDETAHAPQSWRLGARQDWEKAPPSIRQEVHRREQEMQRVLQQAAPLKAFRQEFEKILAPIAPAAQARGTTPQALVSAYVQFDRALSSRDPAMQAQAVAQVIKSYGVDIETLAKAIDGELAQPRRQEQPRFDPEAERAKLRAELQAESEAHSHTQKVAEFAKQADPVLFNEEVRHDMAALIESAAARGVELSLQDAYDRAVRANPEAWAIVQQRQQAKAATTAQAATRQAMAAGSSVKSRPASPVGGEARSNSLREDLEAEAAARSGR